MKKTGLLIFALVVYILAHAQNTINDANAQKRQVSGFHAIEVSDGVDLYLTQSGSEAVAVSASRDEYRDKIRTEVQNGVLKIYYDDDWKLSFNWRGRKLKAYVSVKDIDAIRASGGSDIMIRGTVTSNKLNLHISGGSDFNGDVKITDLEIRASGGSDIDISGSATNCNVEASGGSDYEGYKLVVDYMVIDVSGGSDARLTVNKELAAEATGGSDIDYRGNPVVKRSHSSGGGSVSRRN